MREELKRAYEERTAELRELMRKKFAEGDLAENPLARALEASLGEVLERNGAVLGRMLENLDRREGRSDVNSLFELVTVFAPRDMRRQLESRNFFPFPQADCGEWDSSGTAGFTEPFFLNCPYSDMEKYLHKDFSGASGGESFSYTLLPYFGFINAERELYEAARLYRVERPVIFSPWSRRAVTVKMSGKPAAEGGADLRLAENGLKEILLDSHILMWNVLMTKCERWDKSYESPDGIDVNYVYEYSLPEDKISPAHEAGFVLPEYADLGNPRNLILTATKNGRNIVIEAQAELDKAFRLFNIYQPRLDGLPEDCQVFINSCDTQVLASCPRPRTAGDINLVLSALKQPGCQAKYQRQGEKPVLKRYETGHRYGASEPRSDLAFASARRKFPCRVAFTGKDPFLEDYSEYVLSYLAWRYPEYLWTGEAG